MQALEIASPIGPLVLVADHDHLRYLYLPMKGRAARPENACDFKETAVLREAKRALKAYFTGTLYAFDLPWEIAGTDFQLSVWHELAKVPYAATVSYGELARRVGNAKASRAVGAACGKNPLPIIIPCHRVLAAGGGLGGFGGGLAQKQALLDHESSHARL